MTYVLIVFMVCCGYYTFTYGLSLWKNQKNKLASVGTIAVAIIGVILPVIVLFMKR